MTENTFVKLIAQDLYEERIKRIMNEANRNRRTKGARNGASTIRRKGRRQRRRR